TPVISNWTGHLVLCCMTMARVATWSPWHTSRTLRATRSHPRSLLSMPRLKSASSRTRLSIWRRTRRAQMSLSLKGAFWAVAAVADLVGPLARWHVTQLGVRQTLTRLRAGRPAAGLIHRGVHEISDPLHVAGSRYRHGG